MNAPGPTSHAATPAPSLEAAWPLFGLRIRTGRIELRLPTDTELLELLAVALDGIHPPEEMPFGVAWTDAPRPAFERGFLQHHWLVRGTWSPERWQLNLLALVDGAVAGSQSIHAEAFAVHRTVDTGSWLGRGLQGQGIGKSMREAVLAFAFDGLGARFAESSAFLDNDASNGVSRALGYQENGRGSYAPRGEAREMQRWRLAADAWRSRPHPEVTIEGLDACRDLFGA